MPKKKFYKALYLQTGFCLGPHNPYGSSPGRDPLTLKLSKVENLKTLLVLLFINCNILKKKIHLMFGLQHTFFLLIVPDSLPSVISFSISIFITTLSLSSSVYSHFCQSALHTHEHINTYLL